MIRFLKFALASGFIAIPICALANPYDDCILQHMGTAQNDEAVYAIQEACIRKTSVPVPPEANSQILDTRATVGVFTTNGIDKEYGVVITFTNKTNFDITEAVVKMLNIPSDKETRYSVSSFRDTLPPGSILTKAGRPSAINVIKRGETRRFFVSIKESTESLSDFSKSFDWDVMATKGIPAT